MRSIISLLFLGTLSVFHEASSPWLSKESKSFTITFTISDEPKANEYTKMIDEGVVSVSNFFDGKYKTNFNVLVHPSRASLDSTWQKEWGMPDFKSECWMVAGGVAAKIDLVSPLVWSTQACEHNYSDKEKTQQLITHELVHVYHGQYNASPDFSNVERVDWFVEGLATYVSGQCDNARMAQVKKMVDEGKAPASLEGFWQGKMKYGQSGSLVMFVDKKYGRKKLKDLLQYNKGEDILKSLGTTETQLLTDWKEFVKKN